MMRITTNFVFFALSLFASGTPSHAQSVAGGLSAKEVSITSSFSGEKITVFGNIEYPKANADSLYAGQHDVIIVITGPPLNRVVRRKTQQMGIWLNSQNVTFEQYPSFKWVMSNRALLDITSKEILDKWDISLDSQSDEVVSSGNGNPNVFKEEVVRLMVEQGLFGVSENAVTFESNSLFSGQASLPGDVPNGRFIVQTNLFRAGELKASWGQTFTVRKQGFELIVGNTAEQYPFLYGLICICLALFTGWLGGVVFKR